MTNNFNLLHSLTCIACSDILVDPITLSCGYTICSHCFPISSPTSIKKSFFKCPAPHCDAATHLFGPQLSLDVTITQLTQTFRDSLSQSDDLNEPLLLSLLQCNACQHPFVDPTTTPCGHTFCRLCLLNSKVDSDGCQLCKQPIPKFSSLMSQPVNHVLSQLVKELQYTSTALENRQQTPMLNSFQSQQTQVPIYVSGQIVFPGQQIRLSIQTPPQYQSFRRALIPASRYQSLCLASVHTNQPQLAQYGTILQITNIERLHQGFVLHATGLDRFRLTDIPCGPTADLELLCEPSVPLVSVARDGSAAHEIHLAEQILQTVCHLSQPVNHSVLNAQTAGLLGPLWLESMVSLHGPIPNKKSPNAVCWWAASVLPQVAQEAYTLLKTVSLEDRLNRVNSCLQTYQNQWTSCRERAIHAFMQVPQTS
ncbi:ATP-dependent protease La domain-containing protein [Sporodiniella umbellata]|nr:ATP-dependent protease La domain-containing protein [Sporodiniella umbellata]